MIIFIIIVVLLALSVLYATYPRYKSRAKHLKGVYFHRGRFGGDIKENTAEAFQRAIYSGHGFEFDVHLSKDKKPYVSHDDSLKRVFGIDKKVSLTDSSELDELGVPSLDRVLEIADGKQPLIVELKGEDLDYSVCSVACDRLLEYKGEYCVESFNPYYMNYVRKHYPDIIRGQLSSKSLGGKTLVDKIERFLLTNLFFNYLSRPDFVAYKWNESNLPFVKQSKRLGATMAGWSPKGENEIKKALEFFDIVIVED